MKTRTRSLVCLMVALGLVAAASSAWAQTLKIRFAGNMPAQNHSSKAMVVFKEEVEKLSGGKIQVDLFPAMQLGGASENVDMVKSGTLFMAYAGAAYFVGYIPEFGVISLPFLFKDRPTTQKIMTGPLGKELLKEADKAGFAGLAFWDLGSRNITNSKRPIAQPNDLDGIKLRLQPSKVMMNTFKALGANPVAMDIKEVYSALKQGVIDAQENPFTHIRDHRFYEVQKYLSVTGHFYDVMAVVANKKSWNDQPREFQEILLKGIEKGTQYSWQQAGKEDEEAFQDLKGKGMTVNTLTPAQSKLFRDKSESVYKENEKSIGKQWIAKFLQANQ
jgi:tripartite ATP-independent transporter DctP family solute receptor